MYIDNIILKIKETVDSHKLDKPGAYARWIWHDAPDGNQIIVWDTERDLGLNEYGCADAANILYTIGYFHSDPEERKSWVETLQNLQDPKTGLFTEITHHPIHTTAHCAAALELFDAKPKYPYFDLEQYKTKEGLYALLDGLDWTNPWPQSHQGAGIYAAFANAGQATLEWKTWYFDWLWENASPKTGFWKKGFEDQSKPFHQMGGGFHYFFNHEHAHMPVRYPEKIIDYCLYMYRETEMHGGKFGRMVGFIEVDWIYSITRSMRKTPHRFEECKQTLIEFADDYIAYLNSIDHKTHDGFNDLHMLFGTTCALAELQQALPGRYITERPLKLVLDRRPFI